MIPLQYSLSSSSYIPSAEVELSKKEKRYEVVFTPSVFFLSLSLNEQCRVLLETRKRSIVLVFQSHSSDLHSLPNFIVSFLSSV